MFITRVVQCFTLKKPRDKSIPTQCLSICTVKKSENIKKDIVTYDYSGKILQNSTHSYYGIVDVFKFILDLGCIIQ